MPLERIGLEACSLTAWLHDGLRAAGLPAICIETRQANAAMKAMPNKTDRNDARALAQIMRTGWYRQVHVKSPAMPAVARAAGRPPHGAERDARRSRTWCGRVLREAGAQARHARAARTSPDACASWPATIRRDGRSSSRCLRSSATMLDELARLTKQVLDIVREEDVCRRLMSVPGVGPITALAFRATIDRPERFRRSRDVGAHLGLTPARYQSGETDIQGRISRCGDELARTALYEAAHSLLVRSRKWSSLARLGHEDRQAPRHGARPRRGRPQARRHPAPHVGRRHRVPLGQGARPPRLAAA